MVEYYVGIKPIAIRTIRKGDKLDMTLQKPIATVNFDVYSVGTYIVEVDANGNWTSRYGFGPTEEKE